VMLNEIDARLVRSDAELLAEHKAALATLGQRVRVDLRVGESVVGVAEDVDGAGRLLVRSDDMQLHVIDVGDVVHLRAR
jgi:BirA family biotin operon repressor/biotin-[acetyl-CoA-carboxylase] ligase